MSYLETLQQHNVSLQSLIDTANNLPEAGSGGGGGGSVDNCTIVFDCDHFVWGCYGTFIEDGQSEFIFYEVGSARQLPYTLQAQCGSLLYIIISGFYSASVTAGEIVSASYGTGIVFKVPDAPTDCFINAITD